MQELCGKNAEDNLPALRVALSSITKRNLLPKEIEWFLHVPGAFRHLREYGSLGRFVEIDFERNTFIYKPKVNTKSRRAKEFLLFFLFYTFLGMFGFIITFQLDVSFFSASGQVNPWIILKVAGGFAILFALVFLQLAVKLIDASNLISVTLD